MVSVQEFWATTHWGDYWHQRRIINGSVSIHSGRDVNGWKQRTEIPILSTGVVTSQGRITDIGQYVELRVGNVYHTYCHLYGSAPVDQTLRSGRNYFAIAGASDRPGTSWTGPHLHFMVASQPGAYRTRTTIDPDPYILAVLNGGGSGGGGVTPIEERDVDMRALYVKGSKPEIYAIINGVASRRLVNDWSGGRTANLNALQAVQNIGGTWEMTNDDTWPPLMAAAIAEGLAGAPSGGGGGGMTPAEKAQLVKDIEAALQDDFAAVNANIDDQPTQFNVTPKE